MDIELYSETELRALREMPKRITNPAARWRDKPKGRAVHRQRRFQVFGDGEAPFLLYQRESLHDDLGFSCGIVFLPCGGSPLTLARYNGPSHEHGDIAFSPHIHRASESAIAAGRKAESDATETDRFYSMNGALACLVKDYNISGLVVQCDLPRLL